MDEYVMTHEEQELWQKVFAAAFVNEVSREYGLRRDYDQAFNRANAELAARIADCAVVKLSTWRSQEEELVGQVISNCPKEWLK